MLSFMIELRGSLVLAVAAALALGGSAQARGDDWMSRPTVPAAIAAPAAAKLVAHFHAAGAQVYSCGAAAAGGAYGWTLKQPDATLYDEKGKPAGTHGAGPSWKSIDGSTVTAKKVAQADAPSPRAIPWLLLRTDKTAGAGVFSHVGFIQRVNTKNGTPPTSKCDASAASTETRVDYSAEYYFYAP
jgi:hypothetical protein